MIETECDHRLLLLLKQKARVKTPRLFNAAFLRAGVALRFRSRNSSKLKFNPYRRFLALILGQPSQTTGTIPAELKGMISSTTKFQPLSLLLGLMLPIIGMLPQEVYGAGGASARCEDIFILGPITHPNIKLTVMDGMVSNKQTQEIKDVIFTVDKSLNGRFKIPAELTIEASSIHEIAYAKLDSVGIVIPYQLSIREPLTKHPIHTRPVIAHEYAHQIFVANLETRAPDIYVVEKSLRLKLTELFYERKEKITLLNDLSMSKYDLEGSSAEINPAALQALNEKLDTTRAQLDVIGSKFDKEMTELNKITVYDELFADLVAVVSLRNPNAVRDALHFSGMSDKAFAQQLESRAFISRHTMKDWLISDTHEQLAPTRQHLGKWYLANLKTDRDPSIIVDRVFDAIISEIRARTKNNEWDSLSTAEINARLIRAIDKRLKQ